MKKWKDNRGSAMVMVIIVIAFVSILIATLFMLSTVNIQMKSVDRKSKENFYSAEGALDEINLGLQGEISGVTTDAYAAVMQQYSATALEAERRKAFNKKFLQDLTSRIHNTEKIQEYSLDHLKTYLSDEVANHTVLTSTKDCKLEQDDDSLVLRGLVVTYTDDENYVSVIETDIRLTAPNLNLIQPSDMPDIFEYSIIANQGILAKDGGTVNLGANIYAGNGGTVNGVALTGLNLSAGANWVFNNASRTVVDGNILIPQSASLKVNTDMDLWAKELQIEGGALQTKGRTYVSNDLITSKNGSNVTLEGEYYGYGNGEKLTDSGLTLSEGGDASAILVNGTNTSLDLSKVRKLLLSGSAEIATGKVKYDKDAVENTRPERDPGLTEQLIKGTLASGAYSIYAVKANHYAANDDQYINARSGAPDKNSMGAWERFNIINNVDGTVSIRDVRFKKYLSVQDNEYASLRATSDSIGIREKFILYRVVGEQDYYILQACANGKYLTTEWISEGTQNALCANRDRITGNDQRFKFNRLGDLPAELDTSNIPVLTFTYSNSSNLTIKFTTPSWDKNFNEKCSATLTYTLYGESHTVQMTRSEKDRCVSYVWGTLAMNNSIPYTINYVNSDGSTESISGTYQHKKDAGNNIASDGNYVNGVYLIRNKTQQGKCLKVEDDKVVLSIQNADYRFLIVKNYDNTVSFRVQDGEKYVSAQTDGTLKLMATSIGESEKFTIEPGIYSEGANGWVHIKSSDNGNGKGKYMSCDNNDNVKLQEINTGNVQGYYFYVEWMSYTDAVGLEEEPRDVVTANMNYEDETSSKASFAVNFADQGSYDNVTISYQVYSGATGNLLKEVSNAQMNKNGEEAAYIVTDRDNETKQFLNHKDIVKYKFTYTYRRNNQTYSKTTSTYTYIHERKYTEPIGVRGENENINLGESLEVKSNQIAYLVPPECIGVNAQKTIIGKNPMTASDYTKMMSYARDKNDYPNFEVVSFTKEVSDLGHSLEEYRTEGTDGYKTVFVQTSAQDGAETMVYFFVDFNSDNSSKYFRDYYKKHQNELEQYMGQYVTGIKLSNAFTRLTLDGNLLYSVSGESNEIQVKSNEGYGYQQTEAEKDAQKNEEAGYQRRYKALSSKLILDYASLTQQEKVRDIFENLIRYSTDGGATAFAGLGNNPKKYELEIDGSKIAAVVVDNKNTTPYSYDSDPNQEICLILATGDVVLEQDFAGTVIAGGTVTVQDNKVHNITNQKDKLYKILQYTMNPDAEDSETLIQHYFRDGDQYILSDNVSQAEITGDYISYSDLVTYEDWTKR